MAEKKLWIPFNNKGILDYVRTPPLFSVDFETRHGRILVNLHFCIDTLRYYLSNQLGYHHINLTTLLSFHVMPPCRCIAYTMAVFHWATPPSDVGN